MTAVFYLQIWYICKGRYVRERGVTTLQEMIGKCTSMTASVYGLPAKGLLREGFDADICLGKYINNHRRQL